MHFASKKDKTTIIKILAESFRNNQSVNFIIPQDKRKEERLNFMMEYCFSLCMKFGKVFISEDEKGCALVLLPHTKTTTLKTILLNLKFIKNCIGISNAKKAMSREVKISKTRNQKEIYNIWFIGVYPEFQQKGIGSKILNFLIADAQKDKLPIFLETSTALNIKWYKKMGFEEYQILDFGYKLHCFHKSISK